MRQVRNYSEVFVALLEEGAALCMGEGSGHLVRNGDWDNAVRVNMQVCKAIKAREKYFDVTRYTDSSSTYRLNENGVQVGRQCKAQGARSPFADA